MVRDGEILVDVISSTASSWRIKSRNALRRRNVTTHSIGYYGLVVSVVIVFKCVEKKCTEENKTIRNGTESTIVDSFEY